MTDQTETARQLLYRHGVPEDVVDGVLCLHAQELAAVQRAAISKTDDPVFYEGEAGWLINLIEPDGIEPVSSAVPAPATDQTAAPTVWIDGHPQLEAIAAAVWERCEHHDSGLVIDDPRNIAVAALAAVLPATVDRAAVAEMVRAMAAEHPTNAAWVQDCHCIADRIAEAGPELRRLAEAQQDEARVDRAAWTGAADWLDALPLSGVEGGVRTALTGLLRDHAREARQEPTQDGGQTALRRAHVALAEQAGRDQAALARVRQLHERLAEESDLTSPDDQITRGAAAKRIATALDGWNPTGAPQCLVEFEGGGRCAKPAGHRRPGSDDPHVPEAGSGQPETDEEA